LPDRDHLAAGRRGHAPGQLQLLVGTVDAGVPAHLRRRVRDDPLPRRRRLRVAGNEGRLGQPARPMVGRRASQSRARVPRRLRRIARRRRPRGPARDDRRHRPEGDGPMTTGKRIRSWAGNYLAVILILVWALAPFYSMLVTALRDKAHTFDTTPWFTHVTMQNFEDALATDKGNDFLGAIFNSLVIGGATTLIALAVGVFTAYALARLDFPGKGFVTGIILAAS